jgi:threonyl-tRNA synthetase
MSQSQENQIDHRRIGQELDLFYFDELAPASPFFMPKGTFIYNELIEFIRKIYRRVGYQEVITPQVLSVDLWKTSGHYDNYKDNMFFASGGAELKGFEPDYGIKPMNCPCHMLMFQHRKWSYRDLPLRYADFGRLHRYELSGSTTGLTRVRSFCQDDSHIFLGADQIEEEIRNQLKVFLACYKFFGFDDVKIYLSTRPAKMMGEAAVWDKAEDALRKALEGFDYELKEGDGAFYGPKIDLEVADALGRDWQLGTVQLDFLLPERFDLGFTNAAGERERPVVVHRAILGSIERFMAIYLEHTKGKLPFWLSPEQVVILPIGEDHQEYAQEVAKHLRGRGIRVRVDDRNESLSYRVRDWQLQKIPYSVTIGGREVANEQGALRERGEKKAIALDVSGMGGYHCELADEILNRYSVDEQLEELLK